MPLSSDATKKSEEKKSPPRNEAPVSMTDVSKLYEMAQTARGWNKRDLDAKVSEHYKVESALKLKKWQLDAIIESFHKKGA